MNRARHYSFLTCKERDDETGLDYFFARYYSSTQGRFTGVDPAGIKPDTLQDPQDINRYAYVANNPLRHVDPDGRKKITVVIEVYIPARSVIAPGTGMNSEAGFRQFKGDFDDRGSRISARTTQVIFVETDPKKLSYGAREAGRAEYKKPMHWTGETVEEYVGTKRQKAAARATGNTLSEGAYRLNDPNVTYVSAHNREADPLVLWAPSIKLDVTVKLTTEKNGDITVEVSGSRSDYPAISINVQSEDSAKLQEVYSYDPRDTGAGPLSLITTSPIQQKPVKLRH